MKNIIIDFQKEIVKIALVENGDLIEVLVDRKEEESCVGNFYAGIVKNIMPNQFVFIDIGQEKNAFLSLNDKREIELFQGTSRSQSELTDHATSENHVGKLTIKTGSQIIVQVIKDATGTKGALVTSQLSISGDDVVLIKTNQNETGISKKIENIEERRRLKKMAKELLPEEYGLILRTSCYGKEKEKLKEEIEILISKMDKIVKYGLYAKAPCILFKEEGFLEKSISTFLSSDIDEVVINDGEQYESVKNIISKIFANEDKVKIYKGAISIFAEYFIENQLKEALNKKVWLKTGGFLYIEETEACVVIDVNSGKFEGSKNPNKGIMKVNIEAAKEIAKQIRLRNLSGIIMIDFIDLKYENDKEYLLKYLKEVTQNDRLTVNVLGMAYLGIAQLTRKTTRMPISKLLLEQCKCCKGIGRLSRN